MRRRDAYWFTSREAKASVADIGIHRCSERAPLRLLDRRSAQPKLHSFDG
jgi:hypothetical protein